MKPVTHSDLDQLIETKPILILDITRLAVNFVETIVRRSPSLIATKEGNKTLPLEIWLDILQWAVLHRTHRIHALVQLQGVEEGPTRSLTCVEIPEWDTCGHFEDSDPIGMFEAYLANPGDGPDPRRPFQLPQPLADGSTFQVPVTALDLKDKLLFGALTVPDVIPWAEGGNCFLCGGGRIFCPGCGDGRVVIEEFWEGVHVTWTAALRCCAPCVLAVDT